MTVGRASKSKDDGLEEMPWNVLSFYEVEGPRGESRVGRGTPHKENAGWYARTKPAPAP